jgi:hypothetical protein
MKIVYQFSFHLNKNDFKQIMEIVKSVGKIVNSFIKNNDDNNFIYINYNNQIYEFNRYDKNFIQKVEESQELNPNKHCYDGEWGCFHIFEIDNRFSNKKYYSIKKTGKDQEYIEILKDAIIEDLYNNCLQQ